MPELSVRDRNEGARGMEASSAMLGMDTVDVRWDRRNNFSSSSSSKSTVFIASVVVVISFVGDMSTGESSMAQSSGGVRVESESLMVTMESVNLVVSVRGSRWQGSLAVVAESGSRTGFSIVSIMVKGAAVGKVFNGEVCGLQRIMPSAAVGRLWRRVEQPK